MQKQMLAAALAWVFTQPAQAAENQDVHKQLAELQAQISQMQQAYEGRITALEGKLAEARSQTPAAAPAVPPAGYSPAGNSASAFNPEVSLILQGAYKDRKKLAEPGISGFWTAGHAHEDEHGAAGRGFSVDHTELVLAANIDAYFRGQATIALIDDKAELEEAWFQTLGLGHGLGLKAGRFFSGLGYLNQQHPHQWDFYDQPLMYQALFGEHSYTQDGVQMKWVAPTPMFVEVGLESGRGQNFPGTDRDVNGANSGVLFAHIGDDIGTAHSWRAGLSYLQTEARDRTTHFESASNGETEGAFSGRSKVWIADFVYKWAPDGNPAQRNFKLQGEYFQRRERGSLGVTSADGSDLGSSAYATRQSGYYLQGVYQFSPEWRAGLRYDRLDSGDQDLGDNPGDLDITDYRPRRTSAMVDYSWSEYARLRLQWARDQSMQGVTDNQITLQYIMSLGSHGAHKF